MYYDTIKTMRYLRKVCWLFLATVLFAQAGSAQTKKTTSSAARDFLNPGDQAKPWAFFWWFNGYVDKPAITKHLQALKNNGFGGVVLYNCPSASIPKGAEFMSPEWREHFKYAVKEANRLGLQMGVNICYGWPAGGKWITPENNSWITISSSQIVKGPQKLNTTLLEPQGKKDIYKDVVIQAMPVSDTASSNLMKITASSDGNNLDNLNEHNYFTKWTAQNTSGKPLTKENPQWLQFDYRQPQDVNYLWIGGISFDSPSRIEVQHSDDGIKFSTVIELQGDYLNQGNWAVPLTKAKYFRLLFTAGASSNKHIDIGEIALGTKLQVTRIMQMAAKAAQNNPIGVTLTRARQQLDFVWSSLTPLPEDNPINPRDIIDITKYCTADGKINWEVPAGTWKMIRIGETNNRVSAGDG
jgi:hypothetical protein